MPQTQMFWTVCREGFLLWCGWVFSSNIYFGNSCRSGVVCRITQQNIVISVFWAQQEWSPGNVSCVSLRSPERACCETSSPSRACAAETELRGFIKEVCWAGWVSWSTTKSNALLVSTHTGLLSWLNRKMVLLDLNTKREGNLLITLQLHNFRSCCWKKDWKLVKVEPSGNCLCWQLSLHHSWKFCEWKLCSHT